MGFLGLGFSDSEHPRHRQQRAVEVVQVLRAASHSLGACTRTVSFQHRCCSPHARFSGTRCSGSARAQTSKDSAV